MAEILATMVVGPLVSMVKEKASSYLLDQYKVMEGMEEQHKLLKRKLPAILDVITDAEEQAAKQREGAKVWLEEVRAVAYRANDVLDEFKYEALRRKAKEEGHYKALGSTDVIKLIPTHNRFVFRYKMANKLRKILQEIDVLIAEMNAFRFKFKPQPPMPMKWRQTDSCIPTDSVDIVEESRAKEKKELVDKLLAHGSTVGLTVLPIVGMGGLGKTTLAQLIYNDPEIKKHFELRLWVCVSDDFDVDSLADRIVKENGCAGSGSSVLDRLQNAVSGKRYLLVLDDVWNRDESGKWERLKSYLQHGGSGSSLLTTTRDEEVARLMMGTTEGDYKLGSLGATFIKKIIKAKAFSSKKEEEWPCELVAMVDEVAKRCSGSPLAATALGSVLRTKTSKKEWEAVINSSTVCGDDNGILPVLKLSYNGLPSHMRQCFAFCATFPKDYEIDVEILVQLWMANGFIPEKKGEYPEIIGTHIFVELASRSFFQDVKGIPFQFNHTKVSRVTCKIHDLMHDVAQSAMGEECAAVATHPSESDDVLHSARHLYLSVREPGTLLNASLEKGSPAFQTLLIHGGYVQEDIKILSKYNSIRALKIDGGSFLRPKYLHHLRYLDLSQSEIQELPEDISILYHLQTLDLSYCDELERLPKGLKYLTALRHLYTNGCEKLKRMPAELGRLTSLQTLTYFVVGADPDCSNVGELQNLDLGGKLELSQLENVKGADVAQATGLGNKEKLIELDLRWTDSDQEAPNNNHEEVVEGRLKPHHGLKVLRIYYCGSNTFPTWMNTLRSMVELNLCGCKKLEKLPALWEFPALKILYLQRLESLHCLCSRGTTPVIFPELKVIVLRSMPKFGAWWETDEEVQGEVPIFPKVGELEIKECGSLTTLPKAASVTVELSDGVDSKCRSAFPALRKMTLHGLSTFDKWEAVEGTPEEEVTFPRLEELSIKSCERLSALPKGSLVKQSFVGAETRVAVEGILREKVKFHWLEKLSISILRSLSALPKWSLLTEQSFGGAEPVHRRSAFPALRKLELSGLSALDRWGAAEETPREEVALFSLLEDLRIEDCPNLTDLPEAPKLSKFFIVEYDQQISLQAASRDIPSLSSLTLGAPPSRCERLSWKGECIGRRMQRRGVSLLPDTRCNFFFSSHPSALALWTRFSQLVDLEIYCCDALHYWPENVFQVLVCLRNLRIFRCSNLTGRTQESSDEQLAPAPERGGLLPACLKSLDISCCESLVEVPDLPGSLKTLSICGCSNNVGSIVFGRQDETRLVGGESVVQPDTSSLIPGSSSSEATASTTVLKLSSAASNRYLPCLESVSIWICSGLSQVANLPPSIKTFDISCCNYLQSLSGQLDAVQKLTIWSCSKLESLEESCFGELRSLEELNLYSCRSLVSLPDGPQAYSSLRVLRIEDCDGIKSLPQSLQSRLGYLEKKRLNVRLTGPHLPEPKTDTGNQGLISKVGARLFPRSLRRKVTLGWCARNSRGSTR